MIVAMTTIHYHFRVVWYYLKYRSEVPRYDREPLRSNTTKPCPYHVKCNVVFFFIAFLQVAPKFKLNDIHISRLIWIIPPKITLHLVAYKKNMSAWSCQSWKILVPLIQGFTFQCKQFFLFKTTRSSNRLKMILKAVGFSWHLVFCSF